MRRQETLFTSACQTAIIGGFLANGLARIGGSLAESNLGEGRHISSKFLSRFSKHVLQKLCEKTLAMVSVDILKKI
jgi:hypothetical protein